MKWWIYCLIGLGSVAVGFALTRLIKPTEETAEEIVEDTEEEE
jgi:hypothetical protein